MERKDFLKLFALAPLTPFAMKINELHTFADSLSPADELMPALFVGHGSPMNAIEDNDFTKALKQLGATLPKPKAIAMVSAHWLTRGTFVHVENKPKMIYDMGGFPEELYKVNYPAPGSPDFAKEVQRAATKTKILDNHDWGFDHGMWSVMLHLFPKADVPVFQISLDYYQQPQYHFELATELQKLRKKGVMLIGSGNLTHNLGQFDLTNINAKTADWALEFDSKMKSFMDAENFQGVIDYKKLGNSAALAHPEPSHFLPLLYTLGMKQKNELLTYPYDKFQYGTFSMRCVKVG
jgi:4,5-DOPA dioxygenase extradiol